MTDIEGNTLAFALFKHKHMHLDQIPKDLLYAGIETFQNEFTQEGWPKEDFESAI